MKIINQNGQNQTQKNINKQKLTTIKFIYEQQNMYIRPTAFMIHGNRIIIGYENSRRLIYLTFSLINYKSYSTFTTQNQIYLPNQKPQQNIKDCILNIHKISLSNDLCTGGLVVSDEDGYIYIVVMDVLNSLISNERKINTGCRIFGNFNCKGLCHSVAYSQRQSSLFVLHQNRSGYSYLAYYQISYYQISKQAGQKMQMWDQPLKNKAYKISVHPSNYSLLILHQQVARIHFYSNQKLFQSHITFNLSNCQAGGFSPLGDKIVLGNTSGLFVINAYTYEVYSVINSMGKMPRQLQFISPFDMVVEFFSGGVSYLAEVADFKKVKLLGQLQIVSASNTANNSTTIPTETQISNQSHTQQRQKCSPKTIQIDLTRKIIILVIPGYQLRFYNLQMEILNILNIQAQCVNLCQQIQVLLVGTSKGSIYMFRWPDIVDKVTNIRAIDAEVIALQNVHQNRIVSINMSLNYRFVFVVSESGELNILEFLQENSINISRRGALVMLKKNNLKPLLEDCLTSISDETKRTQTIVKAIGKQVQINKRNQKICQQMMENLQQNIKQEKIKTQIVIKDQLQLSQEEKKIKNLIRRMEMIKNQLYQLDNKKQKQVIKEKQQFDDRLRKLFEEKGNFEKIIKQKLVEYSQQKQMLGYNQKQQFQNINFAQQTQLKLIQTGSATKKKINDKVEMYNRGESYKMEQTRVQSLTMINYEFKQQLKQLNERKNQLQMSIRKLSFNISQISTKNNNFGLHLMEMKNDLEVIDKLKPERVRNKQEVLTKLNQVKDRNQQLVIQHRELQFTKQQSKKKAKIVENFHKSLQQQINQLQSVFSEIKNKKLQLDDQFYEENKRKIFLEKNIKQMKDRIFELKKIRNKVKQQTSLKSKKLSISLYNYEQNKQNNKKSSQFKKLAKQQNINNKTHIDQKNNVSTMITNNTCSNWRLATTNGNRMSVNFNKSLYKSSQINLQQNQNDKNEYIQYQQIMSKRNQASQKLDKLNKIKNDKIRKYKLINQRLINDHKRLISQLNQLKRYNDFLIKKQEKLKLQIKNGSLNIKQCKNFQDSIIQTKDQIPKYAKTASNSVHTTQNSFIKTNSTAACTFIKSRIRKSGFISLHKNGKINVNGQRLITDNDL